MSAAAAGTNSPRPISGSATRRFWKCPACGATLGEEVGGRIVVKVANRRISFAAKDARQVCWKCGTESGCKGAA